MAFNVKTELLGEAESTSAIDLSSDDNLDDNRRVLVNNNIEPEPVPDPEPIPTERPESPDTNCAICLDVMSNKCYSDSCNHMFCFECLKRWSTIRTSCPLCKKNFKNILHTFNDQGLHETYEVPFTQEEFLHRVFVRPASDLYNSRDTRRDLGMHYSRFWNIMQRSEVLNSEVNSGARVRYTDFTSSRDGFNPNTRHNFANFPASGGLVMRDQIYRNNMWSEPLPDSTGRFRECSSNFFRENPAQCHRLQGFILRDVNTIEAINHENPNPARSFSITIMIMEAIMRHEIRDASMINLLRPYLLTYTDHFCHELFNYANSPYDLIGYDRHAIFLIRPLDLSHPSRPVESGLNHPVQHQNPLSEAVQLPDYNDVIELDSDSETDNDEVISINSSPECPENDSEIEILEHRSIRPSLQINLNLSFRDQPSTSTGIRDTLDRPNNRYNLRRRLKVSRSSNSSSLLVNIPQITYTDLRIRGPIEIYSSSTDDESTNVAFARGSTPRVKTGIVYGKRKKKVKKSKTKKKESNDDSSAYPLSSVNQSRLDFSSSSDDESETRPQNHFSSVCVNIAPRT